MAIHSFSTSNRKLNDELAVEALKRYCDRHKIPFSTMMVRLIHKHNKELGIL